MALQQLHAHRTVALVGFDDLPMADVLDPAVTVVEQHTAEIGRLAAELLLDRLNGSTAAPRSIVLPTRLVMRGSGELAPPLR